MGVLTIKGSLSLVGVGVDSVNALQRAIVHDLRKQGIKGEVRGSVVSFKNWTILQLSTRRYAGVDRGSFEIEVSGKVSRLHYELSVKKLAIGVTAILAILGLVLLRTEKMGAESIDAVDKVLILLAVFFVMGVVNYIIIYIRNVLFIKALVRKSNE